MEEQYLGGLESGQMKKTGSIAGYGVYATNLRIIGVKSRRGLAKALIGAAVGGFAGAYIGARLSTDQSVKMIQELEERKDFEVAKQNVSRVELKKPSIWRRGHIVISQVTGEAIKVMIVQKKDFEKLVELMRAFSPELVTVI